MEAVSGWGEALLEALANVWLGFIDFLPALIGALLVFFIGWLVAILIGRGVERLVKLLKIDRLIEKEGVKKSFRKAGLDLKVAVFIGELVKWFLIIAVLMAAADILGLNQVSAFLNQVIFFIPNLVVAIVILIVAVLVANFVYRVTLAGVKGGGFTSARFVAAIAKWAILIFAILAALVQLGIAVSLIQTLFIGVVAMLAIAGGLAFGLGGKDAAARFLESLRREIRSRDEEKRE